MKTASVAFMSALIAAPAYAQTDTATAPAPPAFTEQSFQFQNDELILAGTLTLPAGLSGAVPLGIIIAGSGPTDRNGNAPTGQLYTNAYRLLAHELAAHGIATMRYDKRVLPATQGNVDFAALTLADFAGDAAAAADSLRQDARFSEIVLIGHSEGAALAIHATRAGLEVDGLVLAAGAGRPMLTILREQLSRQLDAATLTVFDTAMARYLRGELTGDIPGALLPLFVPVNRAFMRSLVAFSPTEQLAALSVPVLIVQGQTDIQIRVQDAEALRSARPDAEFLVIPAANHLFKRVADTLLGPQLPTYTDPSIPLVPEFVDAVANFILGLSAGDGS